MRSAPARQWAKTSGRRGCEITVDAEAIVTAGGRRGNLQLYGGTLGEPNGLGSTATLPRWRAWQPVQPPGCFCRWRKLWWIMKTFPVLADIYALAELNYVHFRAACALAVLAVILSVLVSRWRHCLWAGIGCAGLSVAFSADLLLSNSNNPPWQSFWIQALPVLGSCSAVGWSLKSWFAGKGRRSEVTGHEPKGHNP
jgi:hypothetical protein